MKAPCPHSVLALEPNTRGLGYVAFRLEGKPIDWGVHETRFAKNARCRLKARQLVKRFHPDVVIMENPHVAGARRGERITSLLEQLTKQCRQDGVQVTRISRKTVLRRFSMFGVGSKDDVASAVAAMVPELATRLPKRRRVWESEHYSMAIFEAAALALTYYAIAQKIQESAMRH